MPGMPVQHIFGTAFARREFTPRGGGYFVGKVAVLCQIGAAAGLAHLHESFVSPTLVYFFDFFCGVKKMV